MTRNVSIVVPSRKRPRLLRRCLTALSQLDYPAFEIVIVCDPESALDLSNLDFFDRLKVEVFDFANISQARNQGIEASAGELITFIDDDAVPEPTWLTNLSKVFDDETVVAAGGIVIGPNGITPAFEGGMADEFGISRPKIEDASSRGLHVKLEGTNCMFTKAKLIEIGGFDPVYQYFLEETDLLRRLHDSGGTINYVPDAVVHHASTRPPFHAWQSASTVEAIGKSTGYYLSKFHCDSSGEKMWQDVFQASIFKAINIGAIEPVKGKKISARLRDAMRIGIESPPSERTVLSPKSAEFSRFPQDTDSGDRFIAGHWSKRKKLASKAVESVEKGNRTTLYLFRYSAAYHTVRYTEKGYWLHSGGLYGKRDRTDKSFTFGKSATLIKKELSRVKPIRCPESVNNLE